MQNYPEFTTKSVFSLHGTPNPWAPRLLLLLLLLIAFALRVYEFRGFGAVDDAAYARLAHQIEQGQFSPGAFDGPAVFPLRVGILYPTALLFRFFGVSEWSMVAFPFMLSLLSVLLAYVCTNHFFGCRAALIAAAVWTILPVDALYASILVPDLPAAFFSSSAVMVIILTADSHIAHPATRLLAGVAAGLLLGASWLCKESVVYLVPFCVFLMTTTLRKDWRANLPVWTGAVLGALAVLTSEMYVYYSTAGDWLFHFHETERNYRQYKNAFFVPGAEFAANEGGFRAAVFRRLFLEGPQTILLKSQFLYLPLFASVVILHAIYWKDKLYVVPAVWFATLGLMFNFSSSSLTSYVPLVLFDRYLYPILLPAIIVSAGFLSNLLQARDKAKSIHTQREKAFWGTAIVLILLLIGAYQNYSNRKWYPGWASEVKVVSGLVQSSNRLYSDILSIHGLEFFWGYPKDMVSINFEDMASPEIPPDSYVLVNRKYLDWLASHAGWWPTKSERYLKPIYYDQVPSSWRRVWSDDDAALYYTQ
jgi:4-amino-4-deoxy-L-arabinose transferase-like glycosyltransferase